jgi:hypothetical protein
MVQERWLGATTGRPSTPRPPPDFVQQVRAALRHLHDRTSLPTHPLARFTNPHAATRATGQGRRLQDDLW